jgi:preprotein translocase subunit SecG
MSIFIVIVHIIVCIALIMIVLLQTGKGADMGAAFGGGGSQTLFGATGASTFLTKATTVAAIVFMLTSLMLAYASSKKSGDSMLSDVPRATESAPAPAAGTPPAAAPATVTEPEKQPAPAQQKAAPAADSKTAAPADSEAKPKK